MKKLTALLLAAALLAALLCGCTTAIETISGTWTAVDCRDADDTKENLEYFGFYEDEISCIDLTACAFTRVLTINSDGTYFLGYDEAATRAGIRTYLEEVFAALYENRSSVSEYLGYADEIASEEEFLDWYAQVLYTFDSGEEMLEEMSSAYYDIYDWDSMSETGTCTAGSDKIGFKTGDETEYSYAGYTLNGALLCVTFSDGEVIYSPADAE